MAVDGNVNAVEEVDAVRVPVSPDNPWGNAFRAQKTRLTRESEAIRVADNRKARIWHITNPTKQNSLGHNVGYALYPETQPVLLAEVFGVRAHPVRHPETGAVQLLFDLLPQAR